mgnify:CR=1 FL=1
MRILLFASTLIIFTLPLSVNIDTSTFIVYPFSGIVVGVGVIIGSVSYQTPSATKQASEKPKSNKTTESNQSSSGAEEADVVILRNKADELLIEADSLQNDGRFAEAGDLYEEATSRYETAVEQCSDEEIIEEVNEEIEAIEQRQHEVELLSENLPEVQEALELGESSLQTAIAAHVSDELTIARIRYRQARDQYKTALEQIEETDVFLFADPIEISVNRERSVESRSLSDIFELTADEEEKLRETGFETISDIQGEEVTIDTDNELILSRIQELQSNNSLTDKLAHQLTALYFHCDNKKYQFSSKDKIELQLQQAVSGYDIVI